MNRIVPTVLIACCFALITLAGCQESNSNMIQRARIVANENIKLKDQIKKKDLQIEQLKQDIETLKAEKVKISKNTGDINITLIQSLSDAKKTNTELKAENARLKEELDKSKTP